EPQSRGPGRRCRYQQRRRQGERDEGTSNTGPAHIEYLLHSRRARAVMVRRPRNPTWRELRVHHPRHLPIAIVARYTSHAAASRGSKGFNNVGGLKDYLYNLPLIWPIQPMLKRVW